MSDPFYKEVYAFVLGNVRQEPLTDQHKKGIDLALSSLKERTIRVMQARLGENKTYREIGTSEGVSYTRIMQIMRDAKQVLSEPVYRRLIENGFEGEKTPDVKSWRLHALMNKLADEMVEDPSITFLKLSPRANACLKRSGINTIDQLRKLSDDQLLEIRNLGRKSIAEIRNAIIAYDAVVGDVPESTKLLIQYVEELLSEKENLLAIVQADIIALKGIRNALRLPF